MPRPEPSYSCTTIRIASPVLRRLRDHHTAPGKDKETLSYARARAIRTAAGLVITIAGDDALILPASDCFLAQSSGNVRLRPSILNSIMASFAASDYNCVVNIHDHFFSDYTTFSAVDDADDRDFDHYLRSRFEPMLSSVPGIGTPRDVYNASIVLAREGLDARLTDVRTADVFHPARVVEIGERIALPVTGPRRWQRAHRPAEEARHSDFISERDSRVIRGLRVGVVGCGGLGSILAEALGRVGFSSLVLVDNDVVEATNLNRWQGGAPSDIGHGKAEGLASRIRQMFPSAAAVAIPAALYSPAATQALTDCDLIIGALDNDPARYCLNRLSLQYMIPYFDAGVVVEANAHGIDFKARYFAVLPGTSGCLECTGFDLIDRTTAPTAFFNEATAASMRGAGYLKDLVDPAAAPSVYPLNQRAASLLIIELLNYVCGWRKTATVISEGWRAGSFQRADRDNFPEGPSAACPACGLLLGVGDLEPLPTPGRALNNVPAPHTQDAGKCLLDS